MAGEERNIRLAPQVSPDDAIKGFKKLAKSAQKTFDDLSVDKPTKEVQKLQTSLSKSVSTGEKLANKLDEVSKKQVPTEEYKKLSTTFNDAEKELDRLVKKEQSLVEKNSLKPISDKYNQLNKKLTEQEAIVKRLTATYGAYDKKVIEAQNNYEATKAEIAKIEPQIKAMDAAEAALSQKVEHQRELVADIKADMEQMVQSGTAYTTDNAGIKEATSALENNNNQIRLQEEALANLQQKQSDIAKEKQEQIAQETQAQAEQIAKMLEIKLNAGEINQEVGETVNRVRDVEAQLESLRARQQDLEQAGVGLGYQEYDENLAKIRQLEDELGNLQQKLEDYRVAQENASPDVGVWERVSNLFKQLGNDLLHPIQAIRRLRDETDEAGESASNAESKFKGFANSAVSALKPIGSRLGDLVKQFIVTTSHIDKLKGKFDKLTHGVTRNDFSFKKLFWTLMRYGLGIRGTFMLFRKLRSAITDNLKYFAQFNNGNNQVNDSLSQMMSSLNALKGALASAFVPIINVVSPILSNFIDQIASVVTAIGMFIARLTGAKSYMMATKKATDYAASTASGGGGSKGKSIEEKQAEVDAKRAKEAAKAEEKQAEAAEKLAKAQEEANKQLAGFDELNNLSLDSAKELADYTEKTYDDPTDTASGGGGGAPFDMTEVPLDDMEWNWDELLAKAEEFGRKLADLLNDIFADEDLAKKIGNTIGNLINMAIAFAYGFVSKFDFHQFGRWLGVLLQEAIDTIRWDVLGMTIGEGLNGLADTVIGFFETYGVGSLGDALATMFNNAIDRIVPEKLGEALADVLKAPFIELRQFLTTANMELAGEKFRRFFIETLQNKVLGNEALGQTIGTSIATLINRAVAFFLAMDVSKMVAAITKFFNDIFFSAIKSIDWPSLGELLYALTIGMMIGVFQGAADFIDKAVRLINPDWADALDVEGFNYWLDENFGSWDKYVDTLKNGVKTIDGMMTPVEAGLASLNSKLDEFNNGTAVNWKQSLRDIQAEYSLTDEEMQTTLDLFIGQNDTVQESSDILGDYTGDWAEYKATIKDVPMFIKPTEEQQKLLDEAITETGDSALETKDKILDYVSSTETSIEESKAVAEDYSATTTEALDAVGEKSTEVKDQFSDMTETVNLNTEALTQAISQWYEAIASEFFTYDKWFALLNSSMYLSLETVLNMMMELWNTKFTEWQEVSVTPNFTVEKWLLIFENIRTAWTQVWDNIYTDWTTKFTAWWTATFLPRFTIEKWQDEFDNVYTAADKSFTRVVDIIKEKMEEAVEIVIKASEDMAEALEGIAETVNAITGALGGLGSLNLSAITINIPHAAKGAVIPPNNEFLAVLGDQKQGTNVEAPLDTIKQAVAETFREMNVGSTNNDNQDIVVQIDGYEVFRAVRNQSERFSGSTGYSAF